MTLEQRDRLYGIILKYISYFRYSDQPELGLEIPEDPAA